MGTVEVYILGQKYTIKGEAPEDYIQELAAYVNDKISEVHQNAPNITPVKASILAAINIADELYRLRKEQKTVADSIEEKTAILSNLFD